jgi:hypothetical protein
MAGAALALAAFALPAQNLEDSSVNVSATLPTGTASANTGSIRLASSSGVNLTNVDYSAELPAQLTAGLPDGVKLTVDIKYSANADLSSPATLYPGFIVQTGAGGAGAAATSKKFRIPSDISGYLFASVTGSASTNAATGSLALKAKF